MFAAALVFGVTGSGLAQTSPVSGTVELQKADGTKEPVAGALVEIYRVDIKGGGLSTKTGKKGDFVFVGVLIGGKFVFAVSAPGCSPIIFPNVRAGQEKLVITLRPGDGHKLTEAEVRSGATSAEANSGGDGGKLTAEQEKEKAEYEKKVADISAKNEKTAKANEIIDRVIKEGGDAYNAKNYDVAIEKYSEGVAADPDFAGTAAPLNNNRAQALRIRGLETRNQAVKLEDATAKAEGLAKAKKDLADSAAGYLRAWQLIKSAPPADLGTKADTIKMSTLTGSQETFRIASLTELVDPSMIEAAKTLVPEYLNVETDPVKKLNASMIVGDLYRVSQERENAIAAYKKVLETSPDNVDALAYAGIVLVDLSWLKDNDKALAQEGANYLQKFVSLAPDTHKLKEGAKGYLDILKTQSIVPVKGTPKKKS